MGYITEDPAEIFGSYSGHPRCVAKSFSAIPAQNVHNIASCPLFLYTYPHIHPLSTNIWLKVEASIAVDNRL
jgi:hypothetical protein